MIPDEILADLAQSERRFRLAMAILLGFARDLVKPAKTTATTRSGRRTAAMGRARAERANALRWLRQSRFPIHPQAKRRYPISMVDCHAMIEDYADKFETLYGEGGFPAPSIRDLRLKLQCEPHLFVLNAEQVLELDEQRVGRVAKAA